MQGTRVQSLVRKDLTCCRATKPMCHYYEARVLEPESCNYWTHEPQLPKPVYVEPVLCNKRSHHSKKPTHHSKLALLTATRECLHTVVETQCIQKKPPARTKSDTVKVVARKSSQKGTYGGVRNSRFNVSLSSDLTSLCFRFILCETGVPTPALPFARTN